MYRLLNNIEFFMYESEVWYRTATGETKRLTEHDCDMVREVAEHMESFYPDAYTALKEEYKKCAPNTSYYEYRIVTRFLKCNFAALDNEPDYDTNGRCKFEYVPCPLRGECKLEHVVCRPKFNHKLSESELRVMRLWYEGMSAPEIADTLYLSPFTVNKHVANAYSRLGVHSRHEFVKYVTDNNIL